MIKAMLVPAGDGLHRLFINGEMRKNANVAVGDRVDIALELDPEPRTMVMPQKLAEAFDKNRDAKAIFESMPPS